MTVFGSRIRKRELAELFLVFMFSLQLCAAQQETENLVCSESDLDVKGVRDSILNGDVEALLPHLSYPVEVVMIGKRRVLRDTPSLKSNWSYIVRGDYLEKIRTAAACTLIDEFNLDSSGKITSLAVLVDEEDLKYGYSAIRSASQLRRFVEDLNEWTGNMDYQALSEVVDIPFTVRLGDENLRIQTKSDFIMHGEEIVNDYVRDLLKQSLVGDNFNLHPMGIMLNKTGDLWIRGIADDKLQLQILAIAPPSPPGIQ